MKKLRRNLFAAVIAAAALLLSTAAFAAAGGQIEVHCVDTAGKPMSGIKVQVQKLGDPKWKDKKSDARGVARFDKVEDGVYRALARKEGFAPAFYEFILIKGAAKETVKLQFEPGPTERQLYFENQQVGRQAFEALNEGVEALRSGNFDDAENKLRVSISLNPSNPETHFNLAITYLQGQKWDEAEASLRRAERLTAGLKEFMRSRDPGTENSYDQLHARLLDLIPRVPGLKLRAEASADLAEKRFEEAIAKYNESLKSFPDDPDTYYNIALAQANAKRYDEAAGSIDKAIELKPTERAYTDLKQQIADYKENELLMQARTILEAGEKLHKEGNIQGALQKYEEAMPMVPDRSKAVVYSFIARANASLKNDAAAEAAFKKAIEFAPENADHRKALAQYYMSQKKYNEALELYAQGGTAGAAADQTLFNLGREQSQQGNTDVAQLAFERALAVNPNHADAHFELGMLLYYAKTNDKRAKELLNQYLKLGKDEAKLENAKTVLVVIQRRSP